MKNLMTHTNPSREFGEYKRLIEAQIDNSLHMGWDKKDIIIATNFPYEYAGIKSVVVPDSCFFERRPKASKLLVIDYMFDHEMIDDKCWFHDLDAFQLQPFAEGEPDLEGKDMGFATYNSDTYLTRWNAGSFFFEPSAKDMIKWIVRAMHKWDCAEEVAVCRLTANNTHNINDRYKMLNCTYNLCKKTHPTKVPIDMYDLADKPIKVIHEEFTNIYWS